MCMIMTCCSNKLFGLIIAANFHLLQRILTLFLKQTCNSLMMESFPKTQHFERTSYKLYPNNQYKRPQQLELRKSITH